MPNHKRITHAAVQALESYDRVTYGARACPECGTEDITDPYEHAAKCEPLRIAVTAELLNKYHHVHTH